MFNANFYPTPANVIDLMMTGQTIENRVFLEPSAGKGDISDYLKDNGAKDVLTCEIDINLQRILKSKSNFIKDDFLELEAERISHINCIVMNPPFNAGARHILHAYSIAPAGCDIIALCNLETIRNNFTQERRELINIIELHGSYSDLGQVFKDSERTTGVNVALIRLKKEGADYTAEFDGFFMDDEAETETGAGIMEYNAVRDLVNRYVEAIKLFDKQIESGILMNNLTKTFYKGNLCFECTEDGKTKKRNDFKKDLQKDGWKYILNKMDLGKYTTRGVREDINKFVEQQQEIPFTMKNIYRMFEIVIGTASQRMDKAILEVFERITEHHHENRHHVKGWKTNSHYLVNKKFILPSMISPAKEYGYTTTIYTSLRSSYDGIIPDFEKALIFNESLNFNEVETVNSSINRNTYGEWYESHFFKYKGYKNGNMHFEFKDENVWTRFNQRISKIKGYPLYEAKQQTKWQDKQTGRQEPKKTANPVQNILFKIDI